MPVRVGSRLAQLTWVLTLLTWVLTLLTWVLTLLTQAWALTWVARTPCTHYLSTAQVVASA
eukprot:2349523-Rhodomonas_salina.1